MSRFNKFINILIINIVIFYLMDLLFGALVGAPPEFINTEGVYATNYRNYFVEHTDVTGRKTFVVDRSVPVNIKYDDVVLPKESVKVLALGDSFTAGQGLKPQDTWIKQLEKLSTDKKLYGINYAFSGMNIKDIESAFGFAIKHVDPTLVVYAYVLNDPIVKEGRNLNLDIDTANEYSYKEDGLYDDFINFRTTVFEKNRNPLLNFFYQNSNMAKYAIRSLERKSISERTIKYYKDIHDPKKNGVGLDETFKIIVQMNAESQKKGSHFVVMIFPLFYSTQKNYPFEQAHSFLKNELAKRKIQSLDLLPFYRGKKDSDLWVHPVDQHPNDYAQGIAAKALMEWMKGNRIF